MLNQFVLVVLLFAASSARLIGQAPDDVFPGKTWIKVSPEQSGWSAFGDSADVVSFPVACIATPPRYFKGSGEGGFWNCSLRRISVYDPVDGITYGHAALPRGFFVSFDSFNGGIGFGSDGKKGPAFPVSIVFPGGFLAYQYWELSPSYDLTEGSYFRFATMPSRSIAALSSEMTDFIPSASAPPSFRFRPRDSVVGGSRLMSAGYCRGWQSEP